MAQFDPGSGFDLNMEAPTDDLDLKMEAPATQFYNDSHGGLDLNLEPHLAAIPGLDLNLPVHESSCFDLNFEPLEEENAGDVMDWSLQPQEEEDLDDVMDWSLQPQEEEDHDDVMGWTLEQEEEDVMDLTLEEETPMQRTGRRKDMTLEVRRQVYQTLLARSKNGKLGKYDTTEVATQFDVHIQSVQILWKQGKISLAEGIPVDVASRKKGRSGLLALTKT
ncbi:hypothetical protein PR202_ga25350 [Eleusine coracana subsp. coracana]|uniref:DUF7769 domain-containing protein n=1 Tax=Eleusine coracana subsp. coracana TaxID=191504 RepID=A0AAV5D978_ELECO|nr:hypothetical protein PR202_ga25350 [Eleusine coracana subsp. coracana]